MAEPLKNLYSPLFFEKILPVFQEVLPAFDEHDFVFRVFDTRWPDLELKQRVRQITLALRPFFPEAFPAAVPLLKKLVQAFTDHNYRQQGFQLIFLADFIEVFGLDHFEESMDAIEEVTKLVSAEFAIRPFLLSKPDKSIHYMLRWSTHDHAHVRRLASEGCRSRLPWAIGVPWLKQKPETVIPILQNLKADPSEYVRRSVANNLNDIAKDHPEIVLQIAGSWKGHHPNTDQIIRHGCRTLLKKGNPGVLRMHGIDPKSKIKVGLFSLSASEVKIGDDLAFRLEIRNQEAVATKFRIDYAIDFLTGTGKTSTRIFKLKEDVFVPRKTVTILRKQSFRNLTTRKHYAGKHAIHILINGQKACTRPFMVC
jgi:3-methyladenine DNA glycosylase AlkC